MSSVGLIAGKTGGEVACKQMLADGGRGEKGKYPGGPWRWGCCLNTLAFGIKLGFAASVPPSVELTLVRSVQIYQESDHLKKKPKQWVWNPGLGTGLV